MRKTLESKALDKILKDDKVRVHLLSNILQLIDTLNCDEKGLNETRFELDFQIHKSIIEGSENYILIQCWNTIAPILITLMKLNSKISDKKRNTEQYFDKNNEIIQLLVEHDYRVIQVMNEHLDESKDWVINSLKKIGYI